jgi:hypothetical protein
MKMCTFPTEEKNSSRSLALILCDNCIQNTVRASRSSGESSSTGLLLYKQTTISRQHRCRLFTKYSSWSSESLMSETQFMILYPGMMWHSKSKLWNENVTVQLYNLLLTLKNRTNCLLSYGCLIQKMNKTGNVRINGTPRHVHKTIVAVVKQCVTYSECLCSLSYTAHKAHGPYYIAICALSGSTIFFHITS